MQLPLPFRLLPIVLALVLGSSAGQGAQALAERPVASSVRHFIEFRARRGPFVGHTLLVYGTMDARGRTVDAHSAGFIPDEDAMNMIGPVRGVVGLDREDHVEPVTDRYRRMLTAAEYDDVLFAVRYLRENQHLWHLLFFNCNDFAIVVAESIGMRRPPSWLPPSAFVSMLRAMNARAGDPGGAGVSRKATSPAARGR